jgi:hypothetical protein
MILELVEGVSLEEMLRRGAVEVPVAINYISIMRALAKDPDARFQTALEFQAALRDLGHGPVTPGATAATAPELAELKIRLSSILGPIAKRLVAVADAAHRYGTIAEIRRARFANGRPQGA